MRIRLLHLPTLIVMFVLSALAISLSVMVGWALVHPEGNTGVGPWGTVAIGALGLFFGLLGLFIGYGAIGARRDTITIDRLGIRRAGGFLRWSLSWAEVRAVGVGRTVSVRRSHTPIPRRLRTRRRAQLLIGTFEPDSGSRHGLERMRRPGLPEPFTHLERLPDTRPWTRRFRLADTLDETLHALVPDRYVALTDESVR